MLAVHNWDLRYLPPALQGDVRPGNWDLSQVPALDLEGGGDIDLGQAILSAGNAVWAQLGPLDEQQLPAELAKPLKTLGVPRASAEVIAEGINLLPHPHPGQALRNRSSTSARTLGSAWCA